MSQRRPIEELFAELFELKTAAKREACLDEVCGEDRDRRSRLEKLLAANEKAGSSFGTKHWESSNPCCRESTCRSARCAA